MYQDHTDEYSFLLKPTKHGIGVFTIHSIAAGTYLRLFGTQDHGVSPDRTLLKKDVPLSHRPYCINLGPTCICPRDFGCMPVGWYLNHSDQPNARNERTVSGLRWYANRNILAEEEILINYRTLGEPTDQWDDFYQDNANGDNSRNFSG